MLVHLSARCLRDAHGDNFNNLGEREMEEVTWVKPEGVLIVEDLRSYVVVDEPEEPVNYEVIIKGNRDE